MSAFETPYLECRWIDGRVWEVRAPFDYSSDVLGRVIRIPIGFRTNFASVPRPLWPVMPPTGPYGKAALVHDLLYQIPGLASRAQADRVFREAMELLGVGRVTRWIMYAGVRAGGSSSYHGTDITVTTDASGHALA